MAEEENETDIDPEAEAEGNEEGSGGGKSKLIIIGVVLAILGVGGYFAVPAIMNMISPPVETDGEAVDEKKISKPALFASLHPPLVVNFKDSYGESHFMQVTLEVMARNQGIIDAVKDNTAMIRNGLILMYGSVDYDEVTERAGKEKMLADALTEIQGIIKRETGETGIEAVYFTSLIIQ